MVSTDNNSAEATSSQPPILWWRRMDQRYRIIMVLNLFGFLIIVALLVLLALLLITVMNHRDEDAVATKDETNSNFKLKIVERKDWMAKSPKTPLTDLKLPISRIIVAHTDTDECFDELNCANIVRFIQEQHMDARNWDDIGWNFLIGGNGVVYVGRGWNKQGAHTKGHNSGTIAITLVGSFTKSIPVPPYFDALRALLEYGTGHEKINQTYSIYPQRAFLTTIDSPGDNVVDIIKEWPHFKDF